MTQACLLTQATVAICAIKTDQSIADVQALYEDLASIPGERQFYMVFDYTDVNGNYYPWCTMRNDLFETKLKFVFEPPTNRKFEPVTTL